MNKSLIDRVYNVITENSLLKKGDKVLVCVSTGPDSMTLVTILNALKDKLGITTIGIAHVNHMIRKESEEEEIFARNYARKNNFEFHFLKADVITLAKKNKMGIEECARKVRYDFFFETKEKYGYDKIAVAHNLNDKVETVLLNMIRGTSLKGLIGMEYLSNDIIRPMLDISKKEVLEFCEEEKIKYYIDKTNYDDTYTRNKVRLNLIPMIEKDFNPNFLESISRMSDLISMDEKFIDKYTEKIVDESIISKNEDNIIYNYKYLMNEDMAVRARCAKKIVERLLNNAQGLEKKHILDIIKLMQNNITHKKYIIGNKFTVEILKKNVANIYKNK